MWTKLVEKLQIKNRWCVFLGHTLSSDQFIPSPVLLIPFSKSLPTDLQLSNLLSFWQNLQKIWILCSFSFHLGRKSSFKYRPWLYVPSELVLETLTVLHKPSFSMEVFIASLPIEGLSQSHWSFAFLGPSILLTSLLLFHGKCTDTYFIPLEAVSLCLCWVEGLFLKQWSSDLLCVCFQHM